MGVYVKTISGLAPIMTVPQPNATNQDIADFILEDGPARAAVGSAFVDEINNPESATKTALDLEYAAVTTNQTLI